VGRYEGRAGYLQHVLGKIGTYEASRKLKTNGTTNEAAKSEGTIRAPQTKKKPPHFCQSSGKTVRVKQQPETCGTEREGRLGSIATERTTISPITVGGLRKKEWESGTNQ